MKSWHIPTLQDLPTVAADVLLWLGDTKKIMLSGDMGAGKTTFTRALCAHLGVQDTVNSPTFPIVNAYRYTAPDGSLHWLYHIDLYRLDTLQDAINIGIEEYLYDDAYTIIEWHDLVATILPPQVAYLQLTVHPDDARTLTASLKKHNK